MSFFFLLFLPTWESVRPNLLQEPNPVTSLVSSIYIYDWRQIWIWSDLKTVFTYTGNASPINSNLKGNTEHVKQNTLDIYTAIKTFWSWKRKEIRCLGTTYTFPSPDCLVPPRPILFFVTWAGFLLLYYYMRNFCNLIGLEQRYFSLIWNTYMWKLQTFLGSSINK